MDKELSVYEVGVFYCHRDNELIKIIVKFYDLSFSGIITTDVLVSLNAL